MPRAKLTALIPAGNEERHLRETIASVRFADEVLVVVDAASTDRTREIAEECADRTLVHEYRNSAAQKNWAIPQAAHPWVLVIDCDERVTPELRAEIERVLEEPNPAHGYRIFRLNHFMDQPIHYSGWQRDKVLRLFQRDIARYEEKNVHADVIFPSVPKPRIGVLKGKFLHFTFDSFEQYLKKHARYAEWASGDRAKRHKRVGLRELWGRPAWRFFRHYIWFRGFLDGRAGFIVSWMAAHSVFLKYAFLWEARRREERERAAHKKS